MFKRRPRSLSQRNHQQMERLPEGSATELEFGRTVRERVQGPVSITPYLGKAEWIGAVAVLSMLYVLVESDYDG